MDELLATLKAAFEEQDYTVEDVSTNRQQVRVALREADAAATELRSIPADVAGEDAVMGVDVTTESIEGGEEVRTVVTFRHRP
ncbi:hypothetical protein Hrd1104_12855 [Halorhabdus sp. CBA1104]|uniref:hypothetical protein n=1 Tax=unclassified Halorhabdus TaxID=2621901 RepID=UPI0012B2DE09|nr:MULTISPECIES: hypothetical protein [unclassified Halorhabdus]QGN08096.1 hypothetical protein Hrd1104_12855 [Halorhabdus sp. CBA1104]